MKKRPQRVGPGVLLELDAGAAQPDQADVGQVAAAVGLDGGDLDGVVRRDLALPVQPEPPAVALQSL